jgi:CDP-paratose 2-epimerase
MEPGEIDGRERGRFTRPLRWTFRDRVGYGTSFSKRNRLDLIVHWAAQPSHDKAKAIPLVDFEVNALGTVNLLEATRRHAPKRCLFS